MVEVVQILVECVTVQLDGHDLFGHSVRDTESLLEALENTFTILMRILRRARSVAARR